MLIIARRQLAAKHTTSPHIGHFDHGILYAGFQASTRNASSLSSFRAKLKTHWMHTRDDIPTSAPL